MRCSIALAVAAATRSLAQTSAAGNWTNALEMEIDPNTVDEADRGTWCTAQFNTCEILCGRDTEDNDCEDSDLSYECTCSSNSSAPGLQYYTQTMPYFICTELWERCKDQNAGDSRGQSACDDDILSKCPKTNPPKEAIKSDDDDEDDDETSTTAEATTSTTSGSGSDATGSDVTTTESDDLAAPTLMPGNGAAAVAAIGVLAYML